MSQYIPQKTRSLHAMQGPRRSNVQRMNPHCDERNSKAMWLSVAWVACDSFVAVDFGFSLKFTSFFCDLLYKTHIALTTFFMVWSTLLSKTAQARYPAKPGEYFKALCCKADLNPSGSACTFVVTRFKGSSFPLVMCPTLLLKIIQDVFPQQ